MTYNQAQSVVAIHILNKRRNQLFLSLSLRQKLRNRLKQTHITHSTFKDESQINQSASLYSFHRNILQNKNNLSTQKCNM